jgi:hypothetical protein
MDRAFHISPPFRLQVDHERVIAPGYINLL